MAVTRPFAFNTGSTIPGTIQVGNLAIGVDAYDYSEQPGGVRWWNGPDEELGYVIAHETLSGNQPNPLDIQAFLGFWRTEGFNESLFISLSEWVAAKDNDPQNFSTGDDAKLWLNNNGYWTSFGESPQPENLDNPIITENSEYIEVGNGYYLMFVDSTPIATPTPTASLAVTPTPTPTPTITPTSGFTITITESGSNVVMSASGTLNINDLSLVASGSGPLGQGGIGIGTATFIIGASGSTFDQYSGFTTTPTNFGSGAGLGSSSSNGDIMGVIIDSAPPYILVVPNGYVSGTYISSTQTFNNQTLSGMTLTNGTYTYTWGSGANADSIQVVVGGSSPSPTPTPTPTYTTGSTTGDYSLLSTYSPAITNGSITFPNHNAGSATLNPNTVGQPGYAIYLNRYDILNNDMSSTLNNLIGRNGTLTLTQGSNSVTYSFTDTAFGKDGGYMNQYWWDNQMNASPLNTITVLSSAGSDFNIVDPITITVS